MSEHSHEDMNKVLFMNMVMMLTTAAMQQLGKLVNPATKKTEIDLQGAQVSIDLLTMLSEKTKGNLGEDEARLLKESISSLQMNYFETAESVQTSEVKGDAAPPPGEKAEPKSASGIGKEAGSAGADQKERKFHKSYGGE